MTQESGKTKYYVLMEELKESILSGKIKAGEKLPSENQLSEKYHISRHTVRKALSILGQEGYIVAEHGRGTFCSQRMGHLKQSKNIAVITTYISDYIFPRLIQGMDRVLTENGYSIILKNTANSRTKEAKVLEDILTKDIDGLIIEPAKSQILCRHMNLYGLLDKYQIPYVFIQGVYSQMKEKPHILMDDCQGGYLVTKSLLDMGHKNLLGIFKADDFQGQERHKGYVKALQEAGFSYDPDRVIWFHTEDRKTKPGLMTRLLLEQGLSVDGIVCYNDQIAVSVVHVLREMGKNVPDDISVTGYDNSVMAGGDVSLTTIVHPQEKLGEMAAELLLEKIREVPEEKSQIPRLIQPELILRNSVKDRRKKEEK
ncbi:GntR family transcriptional regulator [Blautia sp. An81]|uniref:GntR family transcriptional regulator n=1 Tax=Blautia sp. An81 TaxID=1965659 RepID=UPI000B38C755|nr:GntR family transcriptional regulator [Blautia sp. An81]OUN32024.1 LacI family transcriptional regulator [Blautia sp. An81]